MNDCVLLTGAAGFIGSHLAERLVNDNYKVIILVRKSKDDLWRLSSFLDKLNVVDLEKDSLSDVFSKNKIDCVIHLATYYKKTHTLTDIAPMIDANITLGTNILEQMQLHKVNYFINTGTFFEYELSSSPIDEQAQKKPYNLYAAMKVAFSEILMHYSRTYAIKSVDLKLFSPYGPRDNDKLVNFLIKNIVENKKFETTKGEQQWNWTYVIDIVDAIMCSIEYLKKTGENYATYNIGQNRVWSIKEMINIIEKLNGKSDLSTPIKPYDEHEIFYVCCDNTKAASELQWRPKYDLDLGLKLTCAYYLEKYKDKK